MFNTHRTYDLLVTLDLPNAGEPLKGAYPIRDDALPVSAVPEEVIDMRSYLGNGVYEVWTKSSKYYVLEYYCETTTYGEESVYLGFLPQVQSISALIERIMPGSCIKLQRVVKSDAHAFAIETVMTDPVVSKTQIALGLWRIETEEPATYYVKTI